ncbi:MAG: hypothetical protein WA117_20915 [Verrucomicrobiia bacterium]
MSDPTPANYFGTPEMRALAQTVVARWIGTPFAPHARVCRAGVDCVQLAGAFYIETGLVTHFTPPPYSLDAGAHRGTSQVIEYVAGLRNEFRTLWAEGDGKSNRVIPPIILGDLLGFQFGRVVHHVGIVTRDAGGERPAEFIHVFRRGVVCICPMDDVAWLSRLAVVYRPIAKGAS